MSFEGYNQNLCAKGHRYDLDVYYGDESCPECGEESVFCNCVDQTNGEESGVITQKDWKHFTLSPQIGETCNLGHYHVTSQATYRVPTKEEVDQFRSMVDTNGNYHYLKDR